MNTKIKIAAAMAVGLVAGATLIGAAFAAPRMMAGRAAYGYGMMSGYSGSAVAGTPSIADMNAFMDGYRNADGSIDVGRMHADVASGAVRMPHALGAQRDRSDAPQRGRGMMSAPGADGGSGYGYGYGMMGSSY